MADLIGRRFGNGNKWFFNQNKSIAGTTAFILASTITTTALILWLGNFSSLDISIKTSTLLMNIFVISSICSLVELLPFGDDNWSVPVSAALLSKLLLT